MAGTSEEPPFKKIKLEPGVDNWWPLLSIHHGTLDLDENEKLTISVGNRSIDAMNITEDDYKYLDNHMDITYFGYDDIKLIDKNDLEIKCTKNFKTNLNIKSILKTINIEGHISEHKAIYRAGGFSFPHDDMNSKILMFYNSNDSFIYTEKYDERLIGTLILLLPSECEGGELWFNEYNIEKNMDKSKLRFIYFNNDLDYLVSQVLSGRCLSLIYNIYNLNYQKSTAVPADINTCIDFKETPYSVLLNYTIDECRGKKNILLGYLKNKNVSKRLINDIRETYCVLKVSVAKKFPISKISSVYTFYDENCIKEYISNHDYTSQDIDFNILVKKKYKVHYTLFADHCDLASNKITLDTTDESSSQYEDYQDYDYSECSIVNTQHEVKYYTAYLINPTYGCNLDLIDRAKQRGEILYEHQVNESCDTDNTVIKKPLDSNSLQSLYNFLDIHSGTIELYKPDQTNLTVGNRNINIMNITQDDFEYLASNFHRLKYIENFDIDFDIKSILAKLNVDGIIEYKLNYYKTGDFIIPLCNKNSPGLIGTLVLLPPSNYTGGDLCFGDYNVEENMDKSKIRFVYFNSNMEFLVSKVSSGNRLLFTYNIYDPNCYHKINKHDPANIHINFPEEHCSKLLNYAIEYCRGKVNILLGYFKHKYIFGHLINAINEKYNVIQVSVDRKSSISKISNVYTLYEEHVYRNNIYRSKKLKRNFNDFIDKEYDVKHTLFAEYCELASDKKNYTTDEIEYYTAYLINPIYRSSYKGVINRARLRGDISDEEEDISDDEYNTDDTVVKKKLDSDSVQNLCHLLNIHVGELDINEQNYEVKLSVGSKYIDAMGITEEDYKYLESHLDVTDIQQEDEMTITINTVDLKQTKNFNINIDVEKILKHIDVEGYIDQCKFNYYKTGDFIIPHCDENSLGLIGTLILLLPSNTTGGELCLDNYNVEKFLDKSKIRFVFFYGKMKFSASKITSGNRLLLTYNIYDPMYYKTDVIVPENIDISFPEEPYSKLLDYTIEFCQGKKNILLGYYKHHHEFNKRLLDDVRDKYNVIGVFINQKSRINSISIVHTLDYRKYLNYEDRELYFDDIIGEEYYVEHKLFAKHCDVTSYKINFSVEYQDLTLIDKVECYSAYLINPRIY
ncbi:hypothetical protein HCN44_000784 [Aphidius gifuensis]|uniref:Uncharacterized protein n=1 Tax=Aphidius gifuensis TaxID=684658 RepID=A0A835CPS8_APHGI|nr:hypothetical protein HCN44_000784 [Aphidius gifuensis]